MKNEQEEIIVFFDSDCLLCNRAVQFLLDRTPNNIYFASLNGNKAISLKLNLLNVDSIIVYANSSILVKSNAILFLITKMKWYWQLFLIFRVFPNFILNITYDFIAKNRKKWFGINTQCSLFSSERAFRFKN